MKLRTYLAMAIAFAIPGAGHFYLGYRQRAAAFFSIVVFMFIIGAAIDGRLYTAQPGSLLSILATLGSMGGGGLYLVGRLLGTRGDLNSPTFEYGTAFMLTAGLMNLLLVLDAFDLAEGRKPE